MDDFLDNLKFSGQLQRNLNLINRLCNKYYNSLDLLYFDYCWTPDNIDMKERYGNITKQRRIRDLRRWTNRANRQPDMLTIDNVNRQLTIVREANGNSSCLDKIHGYLTEAAQLWADKSYTHILGYVYNYDYDIEYCNSPHETPITKRILTEQPKISFNQPRTVKIIWKNRISKRQRRRAKLNELDIIRYPRYNSVIMIEPSMYPVTLELREKLRIGGSIESMTKIVNNYRLELL